MYNNPYIYQTLARPSLISRLFGRTGAAVGAARTLNWGNILSNTQKSLGIINQAIPIVQQAKPIINNAKTMFKIADILKTDSKNSKDEETKKEKAIINDNKPIFYM